MVVFTQVFGRKLCIRGVDITKANKQYKYPSFGHSFIKHCISPAVQILNNCAQIKKQNYQTKIAGLSHLVLQYDIQNCTGRK